MTNNPSPKSSTKSSPKSNGGYSPNGKGKGKGKGKGGKSGSPGGGARQNSGHFRLPSPKSNGSKSNVSSPNSGSGASRKSVSTPFAKKKASGFLLERANQGNGPFFASDPPNSPASTSLAACEIQVFLSQIANTDISHDKIPALLCQLAKSVSQQVELAGIGPIAQDDAIGKLLGSYKTLPQDHSKTAFQGLAHILEKTDHTLEPLVVPHFPTLKHKV